MTSATRLSHPILSLLLLVAVAGCGRNTSGVGDGGPGPTGSPADLTLTVSPDPAERAQTVTVTATGNVDFQLYTFDFGDGSQELTQAGASATHAFDVVNYQDTTYTIRVRAYRDVQADTWVEATHPLLVKDFPPVVTEIDAGPDAKAIIGEWITVHGQNLLGLGVPTVVVDGQTSGHVEVIDDATMRFRVPPRARTGAHDMSISFAGHEPFEAKLDIKRFAVATSARHDKVYVLAVNHNETVSDSGIRLDVTDASTVKVSPDGSTAYVTDGRFSFIASGKITVIDLTADGGPAIAGTVSGVGNGPLYDIETAAEAPVLVAGDAFGLTVFDVSDPLAPVKIGYTSALFAGDPVNDVAAVDLAVSRDGSRVVALNAFNAQARVFHLNGFQVMNAAAPVRINVGPKTQDAAISDDGTRLFAMGGGGEGAVPLDFSDSKAANLSAIDLGTDTLLSGPYKLSDLNGGATVAPVPFDLAVSRTVPGKVYVTSLDEGFTELFDLLDTLVNDPTFTNLLNLIVFLAQDGLSLGKTIPITGADTAFPVLGAPMQETLTAPTSADLLFNDHRMLQSSFRLWYDDDAGNFVFETGVTVVNLQAGNASTYIPLGSETLGFNALFGLLQPPFHFGDVVFQP